MNTNEKNIYCLKIEIKAAKKISELLKPFNSEEDIEDCVNLMVKDFNLPPADVRNFLLSIASNKNTVTHYVIKDSDKIVAHGAVLRSKMDSSKGMINAIHATNDSFLKTIVEGLSIECNEQGIKNLYIQFTHLDVDSPMIEPYKKLGFEFTGTVYL